MRKIKFRLYNKQTKVLVYDSNIQTSDNCLILDLDGNIIDIAFDRFENVTHDYEIMQFTGLHDKNGTEIYEGDIVIKHGTDYDSNTWGGEKRVVVYDNGSWYPVAHCYFDVRLIEVVGNVYDNPELL